MPGTTTDADDVADKLGGLSTDDTIASLVAAFTGDKPIESANFDNFVDQRMGERGVLDVHGIGPVSAKNLKKNGITKAWQLLGPLLYMNTEDVLAFFKDPETCGVAGGKAKECILCLAKNFQKHNH